MNPKVDEYLSKVRKWRDELETLRMILLDCQLTEEYKWSQPCYVYNKSNIVLLTSFREYCTLAFFKGSLLKDTDKIFVKPGENSQSVRQIRFTSVKDILKKEAILKAYIFEACEVEEEGLKVKLKDVSEYKIPEEFQSRLNKDASLKTAFKSLTPGRQKAYLLYFSEPKQSKTRESRIDKYVSRISSGIGINDCICGLSKRHPTCDGSHKLMQKD
jgi:uncharacterized protein YdeI (YjbR/CyaY-like superfamily)